MIHETPDSTRFTSSAPRPVWGEMAVVADPDEDVLGDEDILEAEPLPSTQPEPLPSTKDFAAED